MNSQEEKALEIFCLFFFPSYWILPFSLHSNKIFQSLDKFSKKKLNFSSHYFLYLTFAYFLDSFVLPLSWKYSFLSGKSNFFCITIYSDLKSDLDILKSILYKLIVFVESFCLLSIFPHNLNFLREMHVEIQVIWRVWRDY